VHIAAAHWFTALLGPAQKGTLNKRTLEVQQLLEELGCDPLEGMARIAMDERNSPELRGRMYSELAQYVAPKRRAVEHSGDMGGSFADFLAQLGKTEQPASEARAEGVEGVHA
jgi:hypothetical protein